MNVPYRCRRVTMPIIPAKSNMPRDGSGTWVIPALMRDCFDRRLVWHEGPIGVREADVVCLWSRTRFRLAQPVFSIGSILPAILPVFVIIGCGFALRRARLLKSGADEGLMALVVQLLMPALILDNVIGNDLLRDPVLLASASGCGFGFVALAMGIGYLLAPAAGLRSNGDGRRTFALGCGIQNYGYLAIPVMAAVFQNDQNLGVLFVHSLGVELALWTLGLILLTGETRSLGKRLINGPVVALVLGLGFNAVGFDQVMPGSIKASLSLLGACAIPIGLILVGLTIADLLKDFRPRCDVVLWSVAIRLGLIPALMLFVVAWLPLSRELAQVVAIQAAMPAGVFPIVLARHYGGHPATAVEIVLGTTVVSLATMPFVAAIGRMVVGG